MLEVKDLISAYKGGDYMMGIWQIIGIGVLVAAMIILVVSFVMMISKKPSSVQKTAE